ncbi:MAG TPA: hypothetical protein PLY87_10280, partial [Planctomycetaceae bacterium]|nr:hypothetical protein [Planctomycetaceae bacterium]
ADTHRSPGYAPGLTHGCLFVCPHSADKMLDANRSRHWTIGQNGSTVNIPDSVAGEVRAKENV